VNRFADFAHRLGMKRAFASLEGQWGSLANRSVLDLGCGRGRWSREYASRGAHVTGVDISPDAIDLLAKEMPEHRFLCADIVALRFPDTSFDIVNSVTVLQHVPEANQRTALSLISQWLKPGGTLVLLDNVVAFGAPHVFPHRTDEWVGMVEAAGLTPTSIWSSNFEPLFRLASNLGLFDKIAPWGGKSISPSAHASRWHRFR
jgi:SAM-dependent methyltransferase